MIVKIPTIVVTPKDRRYRMSREDFSFVRMLVLSARDISQEETAQRLNKLLTSDLKFKNKKAFSISLSAMPIDTENFTISSTRHKLTDWEQHYMRNLLECAAVQPDIVVILPSYIKIVSPAIEAIKDAEDKPRRTRRKRPAPDNNPGE